LREPFIYIASETAGFTCPPLMLAIRKITNVRAAPIINGLPPLAKIERIKKKAPMYSATYEAKVIFIFYYRIWF
jgi:hypothetical protein